MDYLKKHIQQLLGKYLYKSAYDRAMFSMIGVVVKEIRVSFSQFFTWRHPLFSIYRILTIITSSILRLFLGRSAKFSFGYTGEDRIIEGILKPLITKNGFFVDVGCNHPVFISNTYGLYRKGWRGICIDANPDLIKKYAAYRPKDKAVCELVSDGEREASFYVVQNDVLSTIESDIVHKYKEEGLMVEETIRQTKTLTTILNEQNAPKEIDFLTIDAEDQDFQVLSSLDFNLYSPRLIVVEDDSFDIQAFDKNKFYVFLSQRAYTFKGFVLDNMYFIREETKHNEQGGNAKH